MKPINTFTPDGSNHADRSRLCETANEYRHNLRCLRYAALVVPELTTRAIDDCEAAYRTAFTNTDACEAFLDRLAYHLDLLNLPQDKQDEHFLRACRAVGLDNWQTPEVVKTAAFRKADRLISAILGASAVLLVLAAFALGLWMQRHNADMDAKIRVQEVRTP